MPKGHSPAKNHPWRRMPQLMAKRPDEQAQTVLDDLEYSRTHQRTPGARRYAFGRLPKESQ